MAVTTDSRSIEAWRDQLEEELVRPEGLLALSGLHWVAAGINTIGSSPDCTICLPKPIPRLLGVIEYDGRSAVFKPDIGQTVERDGSLAAEPIQLALDGPQPRRVIRSSGFSMALAAHFGRLLLQVWEPATTVGASGGVRRWFEIDPAMRVRAAYTGYPVPVMKRIPDSLGALQEGYIQGHVSFKIGGRAFRLDGAEMPDGRLFLQFRDSTNGSETFADGRYLETEPVSEDGTVYMDFNRAYNPPSTFTPFAPCLLAPKADQLDLPIRAGEKTPVIVARPA